MSASGFGAFMEGLQGGVKSGQNIRRERQMDDIYDAARRKIKNEETADDIGRGSIGLPLGDTTSLGDPLGQRIWDWASSLFKGGDKASKASATAVPDPGAAEFQDKVQRVDSLTPEDGYTAAPVQYAADGGQVMVFADGASAAARDPLAGYRDYATAADRVGAEATPIRDAAGRVVGYAKDAASRVRSAIPTKIGIDKLGGVADDAGVVAKTLGRVKGTIKGAGIGYLAGQTISGAKDAYDTPTDQMAADMGITYNPPDGILGAGYDAAIRAGGTMQRVGNAILGQDNPEPASPAEPTPTAVPAPGRTATSGGGSRRGGSRGAASTAIPASPAATPEKVMSEDVIKRIPWDKVNPMDLPKFKTQDWVGYRDTAVKQLVMRGGVTVADAMDKVDQQVIGMQQRGTKALLQEAILRLQGGDLKGAGNALVQMFQYVPSGTDAVVGTYNGQLVAQFIDEQTGQPVGDPTPVDAKMLGDLWQQYGNPAEWSKMAQDRAQLADTEKRTGILGRAQDLAENRYRNVEIPEAQSNADYRAMLGEAALAKGVGGDGLKPSEGLASDKAATEIIDRYSMMADADGKPLYPKLQDPAIREKLLAAIMVLSRRDPSKPASLILQDILNAAKE